MSTQPTRTPPTPSALSRTSAGIFASYFVWSLGTGAQGLARPLFAFLVSGQIFFAPLLASTNALARTVSSPITGYMTDRVGRKPMVVIGTSLRAGSSFLEIFVGSFIPFAILEFIGQLGVSMWMTSSSILIADVSNETNRGRAVATRTMSMRLGMILGPLIAGALATIDLRYVFAFNGITKTITLVMVLVMVSETRPESARRRTSEPGAKRGIEMRYFRTRAFFALAMVTFGLAMLSTGVFLSIFPVYLQESMGATKGQIGLAITLAGALSLAVALPNGLFVDRYGRKKSLVPGLFLLAFVGFGLAMVDTYLAVLAVVSIYGLAEGLAMGSSQAYAMDLAPEDRRGEFLGVWAVFQNGGAMFAPLLIGGIYALAGPPAAFATVGVWLFVSGALMAAFGPETGGRAARAKREAAEAGGPSTG